MQGHAMLECLSDRACMRIVYRDPLLCMHGNYNRVYFELSSHVAENGQFQRMFQLHRLKHPYATMLAQHST